MVIYFFALPAFIKNRLELLEVFGILCHIRKNFRAAEQQCFVFVQRKIGNELKLHARSGELVCHSFADPLFDELCCSVTPESILERVRPTRPTRRKSVEVEHCGEDARGFLANEGRDLPLSPIPVSNSTFVPRLPNDSWMELNVQIPQVRSQHPLPEVP